MPAADGASVDAFSVRSDATSAGRVRGVTLQCDANRRVSRGADVVDVAITADAQQLEAIGRKIESNRQFMQNLDAIRARSTSWLGFLEDIKPHWAAHSTLWQLMDNSEMGFGAAYERFRELFGTWPKVQVENLRWWPFEEGVIQRMEYRFTTYGDVQLWCPGFALLFIENDPIVRWEDYFDSYSFNPILRTALGETRRPEKSRRQPPFR